MSKHTARKSKKRSMRGWILIAAALVLGGGAVVFIAAAEDATRITVNSEPVTAEQVALGKAAYQDQCAVCHGATGEGQPNWKTPDANGNLPAPPHNAAGHTWHHPDSLLLEIIADGGSRPGSGMPAFKDVLSAEERVAVLAYIKTFWGEDEFSFQQQVTRQDRN
jgi:mono/diheme cytochrome c family protein